MGEESIWTFPHITQKKWIVDLGGKDKVFREKYHLSYFEMANFSQTDHKCKPWNKSIKALYSVKVRASRIPLLREWQSWMEEDMRKKTLSTVYNELQMNF